MPIPVAELKAMQRLCEAALKKRRAVRAVDQAGSFDKSQAALREYDVINAEYNEALDEYERLKGGE